MKMKSKSTLPKTVATKKAAAKSNSPKTTSKVADKPMKWFKGG